MTPAIVVIAEGDSVRCWDGNCPLGHVTPRPRVLRIGLKSCLIVAGTVFAKVPCNRRESP